jgi:hypothetical protein
MIFLIKREKETSKTTSAMVVVSWGVETRNESDFTQT